MNDARFWENVCNTCSKVIECKKSLNWHKKIHTDLSTFECNLCHKVLRRKFTYLRHMREKHGEEEDEAENIQMKILTRFDVKKKSYICYKCNKKFALQRYLNLHLKTSHQDIKQYKCKPCDKSFKLKRSLRHHQDVLHKKIENNFLCVTKDIQCKECNKKFTREDNLKAHVKYFHTNQEQHFSCNFCDRIFLNK